MSATCKISKYINNKKALYAKREKAEEKFLNEFVELYNEVKPIIDFMKQEDLYFFHPELSKNQRSDLGPIIGCDSSTHLYVYTGNFVRAFNSRMEEDKALGRPLNEFLAVCDKKFAYKGLAYMREYLEERLKNYDSATDEIIQLTDTMISEQKR